MFKPRNEKKAKTSKQLNIRAYHQISTPVDENCHGLASMVSFLLRGRNRISGPVGGMGFVRFVRSKRMVEFLPGMKFCQRLPPMSEESKSGEVFVDEMEILRHKWDYKKSKNLHFSFKSFYKNNLLKKKKVNCKNHIRSSQRSTRQEWRFLVSGCEMF